MLVTVADIYKPAFGIPLDKVVALEVEQEHVLIKYGFEKGVFVELEPNVKPQIIVKLSSEQINMFMNLLGEK